MGNFKKKSLLLIALYFLLLTALVACSSSEAKENEPMDTGLDKNEFLNIAFKDQFPLQWESYMKNMVNEKDVIPKSDPSIEPYLPALWSGYGFAVEYNTTRGHTYALEDQINIRRVTDKTGGSCLTCKSSVVPHLLSDEEFGDEYWAANFNNEILPRITELGAPGVSEELGEWGHISIGCSDCHDPVTMELRVTRPSFTNAMERMGVDLSRATQNDMRTYVCAQCHVEYYFEPEKNKVTFPWDLGLRVENIYEYKETIAKEQGFDYDWIHQISGTPSLKAQHPEFELSSYGPHGTAGVSCSDCHMPYQRVDGKKKISSHRWGSPLETIEESCRTCHGDKTPTQLEDRVKDIQERHKVALLEAQELNTISHYYVNRMITAGVSEEKIGEAQQHVRKAQWYWDFIAAENSYGFHNPDGSIDAFRISSIESQAAIVKATEELAKLGEDIEELKRQIEVTMQTIYDEEDHFEKHKHAINEWFPAQY
ncbi:nitrite reductase [Anaerobacillus alkalilacustris]|uniref:nitrite reductase (cytochrome; ammonia-forming) n=1 Tax=Anaerobacillus alkalilacustris TaxID=393763 RepID=A0A1S2M0U9_9BACI|nr:ammonia-forming cytochrome c nitrite reductase subunit c552 [Anaerobacillus alkalilacustris]OIJ17587.1 nitrite reductase [Anaerobacillus alkalilacustris]